MRKLIEIVIIFLTIFSCQYENHQITSDKDLTEKIESEFKAGAEMIDLSQLNSFEWDNLLILGPYSIIEQTEKELNLDLKNLRDNRIKSSDIINLFVFLKNNKSIKIAEVSRGIGDFENLKQLISKNNVKFSKTIIGTNVLTGNINGKLIKRFGEIPESAFWIEKNENGNWFNVDWVHDHKNNAMISIFDEKGDLIAKSKFVKVCAGEGKLISSLKKEIDFYDGKNIQLKEKNCYLMKK